MFFLAEKICTVYENAVKMEPQNEELLTHLFMAHVRMGHYKRQKEVALDLYKSRPKTPYFFWAVMSIVLQTTMGQDEKINLNITLPLAERMILKIEKENKIEQEQEVRLYLLVLQMQVKLYFNNFIFERIINRE